MTFRQRFLLGQTDFEEIFDLTDEWNYGDDPRTLREYLGLTADEEDIWISESDEALEEYMEKEKNRCILFTDIDGTLVNDERKLTETTIKGINEFLRKNHYVVLSTGRARRSTIDEAALLGLNQKNCFAICYNGAQIYDLSSGECIYNNGIDLDLVRLCFNEAHKFGIHIQTYTANEVIAEKENDELDIYAAKLKIDPRIVPDVIEELKQINSNPPKMLAINTKDPSAVTAFRSHLTEVIGDRLNVFNSNPTYLEIVAPSVSKGTAVRFLCEYLGVQRKNSAAAGDAENDISMLEAAGIGVAMKNATEEVKKSADYITTKDNNHDGILEVLTLFHK